MGCGLDARVDYVTFTLKEKMPSMRKLMDSGWTDRALASYYGIAEYTVRRIRRLHERDMLDYYIGAVNHRYGTDYAVGAVTPVIYDTVYNAARVSGKASIGTIIPYEPADLVKTIVLAN